MKTRFVCTWTNNFFGRLARKLGYRWGHVALVFMISENFPRAWLVIESTWWRVRSILWEDFIDRYTEYAVYRAKDDLSSRESQSASDYAWGNVGKIYNFYWLIRLVIAILLGKEKSIQQVTSHICSSLVADVFAYVGHPLVDEHISWVTPDDLADSDRTVRLVYIDT